MSESAQAVALSAPLLTVRNLTVQAGDPAQQRSVVAGVSFEIRSGETLGLVGESGSGKTLSALSIAGLLPRAARIGQGSIELDGVELVGLPERRRRAVLASRIGVVFQNPSTALNPRLTIGAQVKEALPGRYWPGSRPAMRAAAELLDQVGVPRAAERLAYYPHELSGGLNQRVVIAMAIARNPSLLIADEPTTALDVSIQAQVLDLIDWLRAERQLGVLLVSHDIGVIADRSDRMAVMNAGNIVETGDTAEVLSRPAHECTRHLLAAMPGLHKRAAIGFPPSQEQSLVELQGVVREFRTPGTRRERQVIRAVDEVSLSIRPGTSLGIVGESGSGKTTLARIMVGLDRPTQGRVSYAGREIAALTPPQRRQWRRDVQYVFQDPYGALDPRLTVEQSLAEPIELSGTAAERAGQSARIGELLDEVELPSSFRRRLPGQLSGGQRQRVVIARALALSPQLVVADEPVSSLDLSVQATVIDLLRRLQRKRGLTYVVISHDLAVIKALCEEVAVITAGRIVEAGRTDAIFDDPQHDYTRKLLESIPGRGTLWDLSRDSPLAETTGLA
jgi:peptide/nickel transport system ATP-binding protein